MDNISFVRCNYETYNSLTTDENTIYFILDIGAIYQGNNLVCTRSSEINWEDYNPILISAKLGKSIVGEMKLGIE